MNNQKFSEKMDQLHKDNKSFAFGQLLLSIGLVLLFIISLYFFK